MKYKYLLSVIAIVAITKTTYAQYAQDALRFSTFQPGGTARIKGVGNAGTAIGGDLSNIGNNPAGLGFFTHSEMSITPEFNGSKAGSTYFGQSGKATNNTGNLSNASILFFSRLNTPSGADKTKGWLSLNFGAAYNRTNNFYQNISYGGRNPNTSIANYYAEQANAGGIDEGSLAGWAYDQNLIDQYANGTGTIYKSNALAGVNQTKNTYSEGGQSEINFSMGANYSNKLYLGFGIGITDIRYNTSSTFTETGTASVLENNAAVNRTYTSNYDQEQVTKGTGFNARFGVIYKPDNAVRIGATITTPTWYNIDDNYNEGLRTQLSNGFGQAQHTTGDPYAFSYNLRTPLKVAGGLAVFIKDLGFITGDVEYQDYSSIHLDFGDGGSDNADNNDIKSLYRSVVNARVGAEIKADQLYIRGGYGVQGNPMKSYGGNINTASAGLGYRFGTYYVDATYSHVTGNQTVFPYELAGGTSYGADLKNTYNNVFLTLGMRF